MTERFVLNRREAAAAIGLSLRTFGRLESEGLAPGKIQLSERRVGYPIEGIKLWIERRQSSQGLPQKSFREDAAA